MEVSDYGSPDTHVVQDETQARLLSDQRAFSYFKPFLAQTRTVSQAAVDVGCKLDTMLYRVNKFLQADLLEVVRVEKRAGRPTKHYRSVHDAYFIPFSVTPFTTFEEEARQMLRNNEEAIIRELARSRRALNRQGKRVYRDAVGEVASHTATDEGEVLAFDSLPDIALSKELKEAHAAELFNDELWFSDDEARALLSQLYALWRDSKKEATANRKPYLLQVALVPLEP